MRPMLLPAALLALFLAASLPGDVQGTAIGAVPDEPGVVVLPDAPILQSVAADVDGDGRREVVRLIVGAGDAVFAEVWGQGTQGWQLRGDPVEVVPPSRVGLRIDRVYQATPVRLLVRHVDGVERVTVASQPHFEEIDVGEPCCLILHDLAIADGAALRRPVSGPSDFADVITVIDFDGDGTDELLSTESLPTVGQIEFAIEARVHRWVDGAFAAPDRDAAPVRIRRLAVSARRQRRRPGRRGRDPVDHRPAGDLSDPPDRGRSAHPGCPAASWRTRPWPCRSTAAGASPSSVRWSASWSRSGRRGKRCRRRRPSRSSPMPRSSAPWP